MCASKSSATPSSRWVRCDGIRCRTGRLPREADSESARSVVAASAPSAGRVKISHIGRNEGSERLFRPGRRRWSHCGLARQQPIRLAVGTNGPFVWTSLGNRQTLVATPVNVICQRLAIMKALFYGLYALRIYLPFSGTSRRWRRLSRKLRGQNARFLQTTRLPEVSWKRCAGCRTPRIWEPQKANGNIRISELGILSALARNCEDGSDLFEIGTFDGRTTLNLAMNSPSRCRILTLDLPPEIDSAFPLAAGERHLVEKPKPGVRYEKYREIYPAAVGKIQQLLGDSAVIDYTPYTHSCALVFVDGSHAYDYALSDTRAAMKMVKQRGVIIWHDYGIWAGVTKALEELDRSEGYGLRNIRGTSLVYWKAP